MTRPCRYAALLVAGVLTAATTGCSWLIGVSDDPIVTDAIEAEGRDAGEDSALPEDAGEDVVTE